MSTDSDLPEHIDPAVKRLIQKQNQRIAALESTVRVLLDDRDEHDERIFALEMGEVDVSLPELAGLDREELLPIQRARADREIGQDVTPANLRRATYVWEVFAERAIKEPKHLKLDSGQVKNIHRECDLRDHSQTVKRTMRMLARYTVRDGDPQDVDPDDSSCLIQFVEGGEHLMLIADRQQFESFLEEQGRKVKGGNDVEISDDRGSDVTDDEVAELREEASKELAQLAEATVLTANEDTVRSSIEAGPTNDKEVVDLRRNGE